MSDVSLILEAISEGDPRAAEQLLPLVYDELRRLAGRKMAQQPAGHTLQPTALVHEAFLRLVKDGEQRPWDRRGHFFAAAAEAMRRILVEHARRKAAIKQGGALTRRELVEDQIAAAFEPREDLLALGEALDKLARVDPVKARLVNLRYIAGLMIDEGARHLDGDCGTILDLRASVAAPRGQRRRDRLGKKPCGTGTFASEDPGTKRGLQKETGISLRRSGLYSL
jgi:RNA polymerase sigma factor (TIGR02999 family)